MTIDPALIDPALRPSLIIDTDACLDAAVAWERLALDPNQTEGRRVMCEANAGLWFHRALQGGYNATGRA